jgi:glycosyltransferase involved in cell wall biosynthesis
MKKTPKVLVVATSRKTRGGITSVVKAHETGEQWKKYHCKWVQTHRDGNSIRKLWYLGTAIIQYVILLPFYDIVHIHVAPYSSLKRKKYFLCIAKLLRKKIIAHFHPHKPEVIFEEKTKPEYIKFFTNVDRIVVLSPQWERWINESLGITKNIQVIYNPCLVITLNKHEIKCSTNYILFAGTLYKRKGFDTLLKAFALIASKFPEWKVVLAGKAKYPNEEHIPSDLAKELGIAEQVVLPGWVSGDQKDKLFRNASIFCLASSAEGFPMAVLDAWAYGVPVVCTLAGGLIDIVKEGENALTFEYGDYLMLSEKLEWMMSNSELREEISKVSFELSHTIFSIDRINGEIDKLYKSVYYEK